MVLIAARQVQKAADLIIVTPNHNRSDGSKASRTAAGAAECMQQGDATAYPNTTVVDRRLVVAIRAFDSGSS